MTVTTGGVEVAISGFGGARRERTTNERRGVGRPPTHDAKEASMARSIAASGDDAGSGPASAATNPRREAANAPRAARSAGRAAGDNICERRRAKRATSRETPDEIRLGAPVDRTGRAAELGPNATTTRAACILGFRSRQASGVGSSIGPARGRRGVVHRAPVGFVSPDGSVPRRRALDAARVRSSGGGVGKMVPRPPRRVSPPRRSGDDGGRGRRGSPAAGPPRRRRGREARGTVQTPRGVPGLVPGLRRPPRGRVPPSVREPRDRARRFRATRGAPAPCGRPRGRVRPVRPPLRLLQRAAHRARFRGLRRGLPHERDGGGDAGVVRSAHRRRRLARVLGRVRERGRGRLERHQRRRRARTDARGDGGRPQRRAARGRGGRSGVRAQFRGLLRRRRGRRIRRGGGRRILIRRRPAVCVATHRPTELEAQRGARRGVPRHVRPRSGRARPAEATGVRDRPERALVRGAGRTVAPGETRGRARAAPRDPQRVQPHVGRGAVPEPVGGAREDGADERRAPIRRARGAVGDQLLHQRARQGAV